MDEGFARQPFTGGDGGPAVGERSFITTHGVDIVEEGRSITPGYFIVARHVGEPKGGAAVQRLQTMSEDVHRFVKQGWLNLQYITSCARTVSRSSAAK